MYEKYIKGQKNQIFVYFVGCFLFSLGAKFFIDSELGVDPLDSMILGIASHLHFKIGTISAGVAVIFLFIWSVWNKKRPIITPFITMAFVGYLIDLWNYLDVIHFVIKDSNNYVLMIIGLLVCSYASSLIIMSGIGIRTMDLVAITMVERLKIPFFLSKGIIEAFFILSGIFLGGPFGLGTFCFLFLVGPLIKPFIYLNQITLGIRDFGLNSTLPQT